MKVYQPVPVRSVLLLIEDDVREPDIFRGNSDRSDSSVFLWIPSQLVIDPLLLIINTGHRMKSY